MINKDLKKLEKEELYSLLVELASLTKENANFLQLKLQNKPEEALIYYKKKIKETLWQERINLRGARKAICDFKKISRKPEHLLELMVFYVENGVEIGEEYGDLYEVFYYSMESMFEQIIKMLNDNVELVTQFKGRLDSVIDRSCEGWGHKDTLMEIYDRLKYDEIIVKEIGI